MEVQQIMSALEKFDSKLDDIKDAVHEIDKKVVSNMLATASHEKEITALKTKVESLKSSHDRAIGALALLSLPGIISLLQQIIK